MFTTGFLFFLASGALSQVIDVPLSAPSSAVAIDPALLSISLEFFAFPGYMNLTNTAPCLDYLQALRGNPPAVRIGGTTQFVFPLNFPLNVPM